MKNITGADVACVGELLVDFVAQESSTLSAAGKFLKCAGGASANVAAGAAKLGAKSAFIGKVGDDSFGRFLEREMSGVGVDTSGLRFDPIHKTRLAFVSLTPSGERDFEFWEKQPADEQIFPRDVDMKQLAASKIVHISSFLLLREPARSTMLEIARKLKAKHVPVSFDPNIRLSLWGTKKKALAGLLPMLEFCTILRLNEEEACLLTHAEKRSTAAKILLGRGPKIIVITRGELGCSVFTPEFSFSLDGFSVKAIDTTGCGDGFLAGLLYGIVRSGAPVEKLTIEKAANICRFANAVGALTATRYGVIPALPTLAEVKRFLGQQKS